jgi:hypothetical protein
MSAAVVNMTKTKMLLIIVFGVLVMVMVGVTNTAQGQPTGQCQKDLRYLEGLGFVTAHSVCTPSSNPSDPMPSGQEKKPTVP